MYVDGVNATEATVPDTSVGVPITGVVGFLPPLSTSPDIILMLIGLLLLPRCLLLV